MKISKDDARCPLCGLPVGKMPEDAAYIEMLCNKCYEFGERPWVEEFTEEGEVSK